ncbi:MAG TPA: phenylalanine--tRNA ligase subunit beta [Dermatophilaceae bacterium]|nr:phenylalanine--tRNA ligase subunit beta [Dermatophilaceae bacterium]
MHAPLSWLRELAPVPEHATGAEVAGDLVRVGLEEEGLSGGDIAGPIVVGRVVDLDRQVQKNGKTITFCHVDVGAHGQRVTDRIWQEIVCGADNFTAGDLVVVVLPGAMLPGGHEITARKTYGRMSHGMICSERELGLGEDHSGIIVLTEYFAGQPEVLAGLTPGQDAMAPLGLGEQVIEVNVTPDRGYCFSLRGIAREYALSVGRPAQFADPVEVAVPAPNDTGYRVGLEDGAPIRGHVGCDRYVARIVRQVDVNAPSPPWMSRRLTQMGMRPISLAVDVTNYLMLLTGQPLHAFDLDTLSGSIVVRRARAGEVLTTLDDVARPLDPEDLMITDGGSQLLAIAGVMGGATSEVSPQTRNVLIEAAHFDPTTVARSSRRHRLSSEASKRFERGVDPDIADRVAELAVRMLVEYGGGAADPGVTDADLRVPREPFRFRTGLAWSLVQPAGPGESPPEGLGHRAVLSCLQDLGCAVRDVPGEPGVVEVATPPWRPDLANGPDLVEEVARVRGYEHIPSVLPTAPGGRGLTERQRVTRLIATTLAQQGLVEVLSYPFVGPERHDALGYPGEDPRRAAVRLANPLSDEAPLLRTSVLATLLDTLRLNHNRGARDAALYEIGLVTLLGPDGLRVAPVPGIEVRPDEEVLGRIRAAVPDQPRHVAFAASGDAQPAGPWGPGRAVRSEDVIGLALRLGQALRVPLRAVADQVAPYHPGRCARLEVAFPTVTGPEILGRHDGAGGDGSAGGAVTVGYAGQLHPKVAAALDLPSGTCAGELDVEALVAAFGSPVQARPVSTFPVALSDVALLVPESVPAQRVRDALVEGAGPLLEAVTLFDVYRGEQVGPGKKSLAYRLALRGDRTLTTEEVSAFRDAAIAVAADATGALQRGV